jgi:hypothetical protein
MSSPATYYLDQILDYNKPLTDSPLSTSTFLKEVNKAPSFRNALVTAMHCYQKPGSTKHQFLLLHVEFDDDSRKTIFVRVERAPNGHTVTSGFWGTNVKGTAHDSVALSSAREKLLPGKQIEASLYFERSMRLHHLAELLGKISEVSGEYHVLKTNCWWFCATIMSLALRFFEGGWTSEPKPTWITKGIGIGASEDVYEKIRKVADGMFSRVK